MLSFRRIQQTLIAAVALVALAAPATALGQTGQAAQDNYNGPEAQIQEAIAQTGGGGGPGEGPTEGGDGADEGSALPFTGLDLALLLGGGGLLLTAGFGMRRLARRPDPA
jgi:hypothetical protein